jgi:sensor histidine kinase regulating citrate/malate metabolism
MNYRTKLYLGFISVSVASTALAVGIGSAKTYDYLFGEEQSKAMTIAIMTAAQIDGDMLKQIRAVDDEKTAGYLQIRDTLRRIRDMNRQEKTYISYLYTIYPDPQNPNEFLFGVDAEENKNYFSIAGTKDPGATKDLLAQHLDEPYSFNGLAKDPWGTWLTAYAPVHDSQGQYAGTVGVDISLAFVQNYLNKLIWYWILSFVISIVFAWVVSAFLSKNLSK